MPREGYENVTFSFGTIGEIILQGLGKLIVRQLFSDFIWYCFTEYFGVQCLALMWVL